MSDQDWHKLADGLYRGVLLGAVWMFQKDPHCTDLSHPTWLAVRNNRLIDLGVENMSDLKAEAWFLEQQGYYR